MGSLNHDIREYTDQLKKGHIQKAYKGILAFLSDLKASLERNHPHDSSSALYFGYMDMTYFAFTPAALKGLKLKIAIVYLHEDCEFELWLAGNNRQVQAETIARLGHVDLGRYTLSQASPGVDAILSVSVVKQPDFDHPEELKRLIETETMAFTKDMQALLIG